MLTVIIHFFRYLFAGMIMLITIHGKVYAMSPDMHHPNDMIVIAHRGASGYRPEHTLMAYDLAIRQGADYIEPDLVVTKDGHFVARHDIYLSTSTDIKDHKEFEARKRSLAGHTDWFVLDFTLAELQTLKAIQPRRTRGTVYDGLETVPTLEDIAGLVSGHAKDGRRVGLYIELKHPALMKKTVSDLAQKLAARLNDLLRSGIPVFFQCFDGSFLQEIAPLTSVPLIYLVEGDKGANGTYSVAENLTAYYDTVAGFGLNKALLMSTGGATNNLVTDIQQAGMLVHVWTVRDDVVPGMFKNVQQELKFLFDAGVDGIFTDFPDTALSARESRRLMTRE